MALGSLIICILSASLGSSDVISESSMKFGSVLISGSLTALGSGTVFASSGTLRSVAISELSVSIGGSSGIIFESSMALGSATTIVESSISLFSVVVCRVSVAFIGSVIVFEVLSALFWLPFSNELIPVFDSMQLYYQ